MKRRAQARKFGETAPLTDARRELFEKLRPHAVSCGERDLARFLEWLRKVRKEEGYNQAEHGESVLMRIVDEFDTLDLVELEQAEENNK